MTSTTSFRETDQDEPSRIDTPRQRVEQRSKAGGERKKIAIVCSLTSSLVNFRFDLIKRMVDAGHDVVAFGPEDCQDTIGKLSGIDVAFHRIPMDRVGLNPVRDLQTCLALFRHFRREKPDIVFAYTMKPVIYASIMARLARVPRRYALMTGLGYVFTERGQTSGRERLLKTLSARLYRLALRSADRTIVYNRADRAVLLETGFVEGPEKIDLVPGSGVHIGRFDFSEPDDDPVNFLMVARLLKDKGLYEFAAAAKRLKTTHPTARVQLLGPFDPNPAAVTRDEVDSWVKEGAIDYLGATDDVRPFIRNCSVYVLPSYREGLSRTILEAMASGRAVITTDAPGCSDAVDPEKTGLVVPVRDAETLHAAMARFVDEPAMVKRMGREARRVAEEQFDVHAVNERLMDLMSLKTAAVTTIPERYIAVKNSTHGFEDQRRNQRIP